MDETKYELPRWLPWATTACLAALVACLFEFWVIEKSRTELLSEESLLAESAAKSEQNQIEAERIVHAREIEVLSEKADPQSGLQVIRLVPLNTGDPACAVAVLDPASGRGQLRLYGVSGQPEARDYQLWVEGPAPGHPAQCGVFHLASGEQGTRGAIPILGTVVPGSRLILIDGAKGGSNSLPAAKEGGSIVLASPPYTGEISGR
jgi:Anti-sigma-K factor rskA